MLSNTSSRPMYGGRDKTRVLTADQEKELAHSLRESKLDMWIALLSYPIAIEDIIKLCFSATENKVQHDNLYLSIFPDLVSASKRFCKYPNDANGESLIRVRKVAAAAIMDIDPCMEIALSIFHQVKNWNDSIPVNQKNVYDKYLKGIESSQKCYISNRNIFIERNIRLVIALSKRQSRSGVPLEDLIQQGTLGLHKAVGKFDVDRGFRLSTYAGWWIRAEITRYIRDRLRIVRIPVAMQENIEKIQAATLSLKHKNKQVDVTEIAEMTGLLPSTIMRLQGWTLNRYRPIGSVDGYNEGDDKRHIAHALVDPEDYYEQLNERMDASPLKKLISSLSKREIFIISARFGLDGGEPKTLKEVGDELGISRERVRQIEAQALANLRKQIEKQ